MKKTSLVASLCLFALGMDGQCNVPTEPACPGDPVPSVVLDIEDPGGSNVPRATVGFRIANGQTFVGTCDGDCGSLVLAYETVGRFDITVAAPGRVTQNQAVTVGRAAADCHPETEQLEVVLQPDATVAALAGAWTTNNFFGRSDLRFDDRGRIVGAILYDRVVSGDGNLYVAYNGSSIRGAVGQGISTATATNPTRSGDTFNFSTTTISFPVGFENASMSADFLTLVGTLSGTPVTYTRLAEIPAPLADP